jgi:dipeptidyl aminopeptidase/acylaminoacyl peptidase
VRCIVNCYGISDLVTKDQVDAKGEPTATRVLMGKSLTAFGAATDGDEILRNASPVVHASKSSPPVLTFHGRADAIVDYPQSEKLDAVLAKLGVPHEIVFLDGVGHSFDWEKSGDKPLPRDLRPTALAFLEKHLGAPAR